MEQYLFNQIGTLLQHGIALEFGSQSKQLILPQIAASNVDNLLLLIFLQ